MTLQNTVIKHQIYAIMGVVKSDTLLPRLKAKAFAKFRKKVLQMANNGGFEVVFRIFCFFFQTQKLQNIRIFDKLHCRCGSLFFDARNNSPFVGRKSCALKKQCVYCPHKFTDIPRIIDGFDFIETTFEVGIKS